MIDLTNMTPQKLHSILRGARIVTVLPLANGLALELELQGEQHVSCSMTSGMSPMGPSLNVNLAEM
jgi:hypothetical protein